MTVQQVVTVLGFGCGGLFFFVLGGLILTILLLGRANRRRATTADGTVVGYEETTTDDCPRYHPLVRFRDATGAEHTARVDGGTTKPFAVDQPVTVEYDPDSPQTAWIAGHTANLGMWLFAVVGLVAGGGCVLTAVLIWANNVPVE